MPGKAFLFVALMIFDGAAMACSRMKDIDEFIYYSGDHLEAFGEVSSRGMAIKIFPEGISDDRHLTLVSNYHVEKSTIEHFLSSLSISNYNSGKNRIGVRP